MKQCPTCHFTFADFHHVCAFDGTELVPYEKPQSLMKVSPPPPPTRYRRSLKPFMSLTSLAVLGVFLSAVLIGYLKSPNPSIPAVAIQERAANSVNSTARAEKIAEGFTAESKPTSRATRVRGNLKRRVSTVRVAPEVNRAPSDFATTKAMNGNRAPSATIARLQSDANRAGNRAPSVTFVRQGDVPRTTREKSPKLVAILKTTWKFLKKPF